MNDDASFEKSADLLALAHHQGYALSATQLVRWHRAGLLPRPTQRPRQDARGTCSLYPSGTGEQVLLLCSLRTHERRLAHLAWQLWIAGYCVEYEIIRIQVQQATERISRWMHWFADWKQAVFLHDSEQTQDQIERYAEGPLRLQPVRRLRKRVGRKHFSTFLSRLLDLTVEDDGKRASVVDEHERLFDLRILARGLGLEKRFVSKKEALDSYLVGFLLPHLHWFFRWSQELDWQELLEHATPFEVFQARDDLRNWLIRQENARHYRVRFPNVYPSFEIDVQGLFGSLSTADQALVLVVWLALRTLPSAFLDGMPAIIIGANGPSYAS
jgi:hypothetical protein